jgi:putative SOS response-associated peptidase YedK
VPAWAQTPELEHRLSFARSETIADKAAFRGAFSSRRCIIPATGYFEWFAAGKSSTPIYIQPEGHELFAFAGLWEEWRSVNGWILPTCTIVTTGANELLAPLSGRMPAILSREDAAAWLDPEQPARRLLSLLRPYSAQRMGVYPVSSRVNSFDADDARCIEPVDDAMYLMETLLHSREAGERYGRLYPGSRQVRRD